MPFELTKRFAEPDLLVEAKNTYDALVETLEVACEVVKSVIVLADKIVRNSVPVAKAVANLGLSVGKLVISATCMAYAIGYKTGECGQYLVDSYKAYGAENNVITEPSGEEVFDEIVEEIQQTLSNQMLNDSEDELTEFPQISEEAEETEEEQVEVLESFSLFNCFSGLTNYLSGRSA